MSIRDVHKSVFVVGSVLAGLHRKKKINFIKS
jgi:hypothetical protein